MKWHRNPFFHTAVLPPSANPSARPSADLDTAARISAVFGRSTGPSARPSGDRPRQSTDLPRASADYGLVQPSLLPNTANPQSPPQVHQGQFGHQTTQNRPGPGGHASSSTPQGLLAEAATRAAAQQHRHHIHLQHAHIHKAKRKPKIPKLTIREPSDHLTPYQFFYIFILDGLGAGVLSGGINFAIAYAMYKTQDYEKHPIRLFQFPNTLCGDATLTIFIQCVITWLIELVLVNRDLRSGHIEPIGFIPEPSWWPLRWFLLLDRHPSLREDDADLERPLSHAHDANCNCHREHGEERYEPGSLGHWMVFLISQVIRALMIGVACFMLVWPPSIGIMTAVATKKEGGDWWYEPPSWAPVIFKLVYAAVLAILTTPLFAGFWLVRCGWAIQANNRHLAIGSSSDEEDVPAGPFPPAVASGANPGIVISSSDDDNDSDSNTPARGLDRPAADATDNEATAVVTESESVLVDDNADPDDINRDDDEPENLKQTSHVTKKEEDP